MTACSIIELHNLCNMTSAAHSYQSSHIAAQQPRGNIGGLQTPSGVSHATSHSMTCATLLLTACARWPNERLEHISRWALCQMDL
jgi:hypothetical protein